MKRILLIALTLCISLSLFVGWQMFRVKPSDRTDYLSLLASPQEDELAQLPSSQHREGVRKDFYLEEKGQRLHTVITSKSSDLIFVKREEETELAERMEKIACWMQVELREGPEPEQVVRILEADRGVYDYRHHRLIAKNVKISRYILPGDELKLPLELNKPTMVGHADAVTLKLGQNLQFKARRLKFDLYQVEDAL